jgi:hypothetical protein
MMRVQAPDKGDWNKLTHLMKYHRGMRTLPLTLSANGTGILKWWVDAAFTVHPNMSEIVGADDFMPAICWTRYFMEAQASQVQDNILFQDNKSMILLERMEKL